MMKRDNITYNHLLSVNGSHATVVAVHPASTRCYKGSVYKEGSTNEGGRKLEILTMTTAKIAVVVSDPIKVILVRRQLSSRVL